MIDSLGQQACFLIDSLTSQKPDDDLWVMGKKKQMQRERISADALKQELFKNAGYGGGCL